MPKILGLDRVPSFNELLTLSVVEARADNDRIHHGSIAESANSRLSTDFFAAIRTGPHSAYSTRPTDIGNPYGGESFPHWLQMPLVGWVLDCKVLETC